MTVFDRPDYLKMSLDSLSQVEGIRDYPIFFFLDGPYDNDTAIRCAKSYDLCSKFDHPNVTIAQLSKNLGVAHQIYISKQIIFEEDYEAVVSLVDDVEYSPCSLKALVAAYEKALEKYDPSKVTMDIFNRTLSSRDEKEGQLGEIIEGRDQMAYIMHKDVWSSVEPYLKQYTDMFIQPNISLPRPYRVRNHQRIRQWFADISKQTTDGREYVIGPDFPTSQDACVEIAMFKHNITRLTTKVNHVRHIGAYGEHMLPHLHQEMGFSSMKLDVFSSEQVVEALRSK